MATQRQGFTTPSGLDLAGGAPTQFETLAEEIEAQVLQRYASTTARDATITVPEQGEFVITEDTNTLWIYNGSAWKPLQASGTYTPTLTGTAIGTGGSAANTATYTYQGDPLGYGTIELEGHLIYGSTGTTFPTAPTFTLPSGFNLRSSVADRIIGFAHLEDSGTPANNRVVFITPASASTFRIVTGGISAAIAALSTTSPFTWASGDLIYWKFSAQAVVV